VRFPYGRMCISQFAAVLYSTENTEAHERTVGLSCRTVRAKIIIVNT
jgi:hypothetical protein